MVLPGQAKFCPRPAGPRHACDAGCLRPTCRRSAMAASASCGFRPEQLTCHSAAIGPAARRTKISGCGLLRSCQRASKRRLNQPVPAGAARVGRNQLSKVIRFPRLCLTVLCTTKCQHITNAACHDLGSVRPRMRPPPKQAGKRRAPGPVANQPPKTPKAEGVFSGCTFCFWSLGHMQVNHCPPPLLSCSSGSSCLLL